MHSDADKKGIYKNVELTCASLFHKSDKDETRAEVENVSISCEEVSHCYDEVVLHICMYVCMHARMYVCMYVCILLR